MNLSLSTPSFTLARFPLLALATVTGASAQAQASPPAARRLRAPQPFPARASRRRRRARHPSKSRAKISSKRISVNVAPGYFFGSNSDAAPAPSADRTVHLGYNTERRNADILRFDSGSDPQHGPELLFD
jgi:hypothetical protein